MALHDPTSTGQGGDHSRDSFLADSPFILWIKRVAICIFRTTVRYIRNIPSRVRNKYLRWKNLRKRMPQRKTKSKVYVLIGYTSKQHVDRRYRAIKVQNMIRKILVLLIVVLFIMILFKWIDPLRNSEQYKQMMGISDMKDLTKVDPFGAAGETSGFEIYSPSISPTPTDTTTGSST
jgi:uncharacterized membrane protein